MYTHWGKNEIFVQNFIFYQNLKYLNFCPKIPDFDSKIAKNPIWIQVLNKKLSFAPVCNYSLCDRTFLALIFPLRNVFSCCCHPACLPAQYALLDSSLFFEIRRNSTIENQSNQSRKNTQKGIEWWSPFKHICCSC